MVLVTAFEPFDGQATNSSEVVMQSLRENLKDRCHFLTLPVSYARSFENLRKHLELAKEPYQFVLMLGQASGRSRISLERFALNWIEATLADADGVLPKPSQIQPGVPTALVSDLPLHEWRDQLIHQGLPVEVSLSAGGYVCNYFYFTATTQALKNSKQCLFVHLPPLPEQGSQALLGSQPLNVQRQTLLSLIDLIEKHVNHEINSP